MNRLRGQDGGHNLRLERRVPSLNKRVDQMLALPFEVLLCLRPRLFCLPWRHLAWVVVHVLFGHRTQKQVALLHAKPELPTVRIEQLLDIDAAGLAGRFTCF